MGGAAGAVPEARRARQLDRVLEASGVVVWEMDPESREVRYHLDVEALAGMGFYRRFLPLSAAEWLERIHADDRARIASALERALAGEEELDVEYRVELPGAVVPVHWLETRGRREGSGGCLVGVTLDVTGRRQAEEAARRGEAMLRAVFSASPDLINILDEEGRVLLASPAVAAVLGYDPAREQEGGTLSHVHPEDRPRVQAALRRVMDGGDDATLERFRYRGADGEWRYLESHGRRVHDGAGERAGAVVLSRDVTERVRMEEELRRARDEAERASRARGEFLSRMSHELRTPLHALLGYARLLELDAESEDDRSSAGHIVTAGRHLLALLDEVLEFARAEGGRLSVRPEWLTPGPLLDEAREMIRPLADERGIALRAGDVRGGVEVHADPQRLRQVLLNLLSNAVKFNRAGGEVELSLVAPAEWCEIRVRDTGAGLDEHAIARLFHPFERLDADLRGIEGTGLGLALSRSLVESMQGEIRVSSAPGEGSTFTVILPCRQPSPGPGRPLPGSARR